MLIGVKSEELLSLSLDGLREEELLLSRWSSSSLSACLSSSRYVFREACLCEWLTSPRGRVFCEMMRNLLRSVAMEPSRRSRSLPAAGWACDDEEEELAVAGEGEGADG